MLCKEITKEAVDRWWLILIWEPLLLFVCDTVHGSVCTSGSQKRVHAWDTKCLWHLLGVAWTLMTCYLLESLLEGKSCPIFHHHCGDAHFWGQDFASLTEFSKLTLFSWNGLVAAGKIWEDWEDKMSPEACWRNPYRKQVDDRECSLWRLCTCDQHLSGSARGWGIGESAFLKLAFVPQKAIQRWPSTRWTSEWR